MALRMNFLLLAAAVLVAGCVKTYAPPKPNEPAALVKLKFTYNRDSALAALPGGRATDGMNASMNVVEDKDTFLLYSRAYPDALKGSGGGDLEIDSVRLHPGRPVTLVMRLAAVWSTRQMETVTKTRSVPKQKQETTSYYDSYAKTTRYQTRTVTVYEQEQYQAQEMVTRNFEKGCGAKVSLTPEVDKVYLIDFSSSVIDTGCGAALYLQVPAPGGAFKLEPVKS